MKKFKNLFNKVLIFLLFSSITSCGGFNIVAGLKFKGSVDSKSYAGNPSFTGDVVKLSNNTVVSFKRPIGNCGAGMSIFGILIPIFPVRANLNNCKNEFSISTTSENILNLVLKYNKKVHNPVSITRWEKKHGDQVYMDGRNFIFKIPSFWKFRIADDKVIIVNVKTEGGKEFTEEVPVKWGVMTYHHWSFP